MDKNNILILDNTTSQLNPWKKILESKYNITIVFSGVEALKTLNNDKFNLIIINLSLKHINGIRAIENIRKAFKTIPIIIIYDPIDKQIINQARAFQIQNAFPLPIDIKNLLMEINKIIPQVYVHSMQNNNANQEKTGKNLKNIEYLDMEKHYYAGLSAMASNRIDDAINTFQSMIKVSRIKQGRWLHYLEESLFQLGQCYAQQKNYQQSNKFFLEYLARVPNCKSIKSVYFYIGKNYHALKNYNKAGIYYNKVIKLKPYDSFSTQARKLLKQLNPDKK